MRSGTHAGRLACALTLGLSALLAGPLAALADYPPGPYPGPGPGGAFATVVVSQTVGSSGATISATFGAATLTLVVPANAFGAATQITVYADNPAVVDPLLPAGATLIEGFAVGWTPGSTAASALTLTISDPAIPGGAAVFQTTGGGLVPVTGAQVQPGSVTVSFTTDPGFVIAKVATSAKTAVTLTDAIAAGVNRGTSGFTTTSVFVKRGTYVTYLVRTSPNLAGHVVEIWLRSKTGTWVRTTSRLVAADGTAHYYLRITAWTAIQARFAGDTTYSPAASHARIAYTR